MRKSLYYVNQNRENKELQQFMSSAKHKKQGFATICVNQKNQNRPFLKKGKLKRQLKRQLKCTIEATSCFLIQPPAFILFISAQIMVK